MQFSISDQKGVHIPEELFGLFFEDINYAADGGLYAEQIENRSFEFLDCYGDRGDYYAVPDYGYAWSPFGEGEPGKMQYVTGSPVDPKNPHYLRFTAAKAGQGFCNRAYRGIFLEKGKKYRVSFYARTASYRGNLTVSVQKDGRVFASAAVACVLAPEGTWQKWNRYETVLTAEEDAEGAAFVIALDRAGTVEFDFVSMMPCDAVDGVFRRDLVEMLRGLKPGFLRFPGGCIVEGNTMENRYRWKESVGRPEGRRANFNRWAVHETSAENGWHAQYAHYDQTLGLRFYEYFLLCERIGARPLPVLNVGLACQYQSFERVEVEDPAFDEFLQDALDLIEFANGSPDSPWGKVRAEMGHPEPFGLTMVGIGNEQWQTEESDFFARYEAFERAIHEKYPQIRLIGSAGPDVVSPRHTMAWDFYRKKAAQKENFCHAVDEHYYMEPEWFFDHADFYDGYPREVKVFAGEYAAHPQKGMNNPRANNLEGALAEAAFLTGVERNSDVVILASYAPLLARAGYAQWSPDLIWFDEKTVCATPSYWVQKLYAQNRGDWTLRLDGQEKELAGEGIFVSASLCRESGEVIVKAVNRNPEEKELKIALAEGLSAKGPVRIQELSGRPEAFNSVEDPNRVRVSERMQEETDSLKLPAHSFVVARISR